MKLSVVVPFYNVERYIHDCLASIAGQTLHDLEVIAVDDGSLDGSREIVDKFVGADDRFRVITQRNQGLGPARNTGMREARGDYITFVDSDDVIPRDAWRMMTAQLDRTGSDFAAGDARRFNLHGVRDSWVHVGPFAESRERTHVSQFPDLANDRMVWNKIYRSSFWKDGAYEFPAMLYEDYPVTLRAHLEATAVDVISQPIYLWRERDEGELSITQRVFEPRNIRDRVTSAMMVLDLVGPGGKANAAVRETVHHHFLNSDVGAVARAVALSTGTPDYDSMLEQARTLLGGLDPAVLAQRGRGQRLQCALIESGRIDVLRHLIDIADDLAPQPHHLRRNGLTLIAFDHPGFEDLPDELITLGPDDFGLHVRVHSARWSGPVLELRLRANISYSGPATTPVLKAWLLKRGGRGRVEVAVDPAFDVEGSAVWATARIAAADVLAASVGEAISWVLNVELDTGTVCRSAIVTGARPGTATQALAWREGPWNWVIPGRNEGEYIVRTERPQVRISAIEPGFGSEMKLSGASRAALSLIGTQLEIASEERTMLFPVSVDPADPTRWDCHVQLGAIADPHHHDDFVEAITEFRIHLVTPRSREFVHVDPSLEVARFAHRNREIQLTGGRFFGALIHEMDPQFTIEDVVIDGTVFEFSGRWLGAASATESAVLRWHHEVDHPVEIDIDLEMDGDQFRFKVDAADLTRRMREVIAAAVEPPPIAPREEEWLLSFDHADRAMTAHLSNSLMRRLPEPVLTPHGTVELTTHRQSAARLIVAGLGPT